MTVTTEEAERLAERLEHDADAPNGARYQPYTDSAMRNAAIALRSLAAEREALQKRVAELEAQNDTLRHATDKLRAMLTELNARHEPLQRAFITAVELLNDAAKEGK